MTMEDRVYRFLVAGDEVKKRMLATRGPFDWSVFDRRWKELEEIDKEAKDAGQLVGRYITHPFADGKAVYIISKENKRTAVLEVVTAIGDDWQIPAWGSRASISKTQAQRMVRQRDEFNEFWRKGQRV